MKKFRLGIVLLLLALVLATVSAVFAQDDTLGASQGDYDLWTSANASFATVTTVSYDFTASLAVSGMTDASSNIQADLKGTGVVDTNKDAPAFQLDVTGNLTQGTQATPVNLGLRIVGGNIYTNDGTGWTGQNLQDAAGEVSSMFSQGLSGGSAMAATPDLSAASLSSLEQNPEAASMMAALSQLKPSDFLTLARVDENGQAHFTLNIDVAKLLASPAFTQMMTTAAAASSSSGDTTSAAQMQQGMAMMSGMFSNATITVEQYVDPSSKMVSRTVLNVGVPLDIVAPGAAVKASFDINLSNYGQPVTVAVPDGAVMMDATPASSS